MDRICGVEMAVEVRVPEHSSSKVFPLPNLMEPAHCKNVGPGVKTSHRLKLDDASILFWRILEYRDINFG
jgi:hypothetical protein